MTAQVRGRASALGRTSDMASCIVDNPAGSSGRLSQTQWDKGPFFGRAVPVSVRYVDKCCLRSTVERNGAMTNKEETGLVDRIIATGRDTEEIALEAVRKFLDTVNDIFPDVSEDGPRRKVIDSAFQMTEQVVRTWTQAAEKIVKATGEALAQPKATSGSSK